MYEDDGISFDFEKGQFKNTVFVWDDFRRVLTIKRQDCRRTKRGPKEKFNVRLASGKLIRTVTFEGGEVELKF